MDWKVPYSILLWDTNINLEEQTKRLTKHVEELVSKQKKLITENQQVYNQYLEMSLKMTEYHAEIRRAAIERS